MKFKHINIREILLLKQCFPANTSVKINSVDVAFDVVTQLDGIVEAINNSNIPFTKSYNLNNNLVIVSTDNALKIENVSGTFIQDVGFSSETGDEIALTAEDLAETTLQAVLDEYLTIKHYGAKGDGETDDTYAINSALLATYCVSDEPAYMRTIYFPAGEYLTTSQFSLPSNSRLLGEGKGRTIIKSTVGAYGSMIGFMDDNKTPSDAETFGGDGINPKNITVEGFTFDGGKVIDSILEVANGTDVTFRDCEFINANDTLVKFKQTIDTNLHVTFENCDFLNANKAIDTELANVEHMGVLNCHFKNINDQAVILGSATNKTHLLNNCFMNCSALVEEILLNDGPNTILLHSTYDDSVLEFNSIPYPYVDNTNSLYTDIVNPVGKSTDMIYKYRAPMPMWGYLDTLRDKDGQYILKPEYDENNPEVLNWLILKPGNVLNENVEIYTENQFKDLVLNGGHYANLILGSSSNKFPDWAMGVTYHAGEYVEYDNKLYKCVSDHTSVAVSDFDNVLLWTLDIDLDDLFVMLGKNLNLNGNYITNNEDKDIVLKPQGSAVVLIDDDDYISKIDNQSQAVATVEYVKSNIANKTLSNYIDMVNYSPSESWNKIVLATLDSDVYGNNILLKNITVSIENVFRRLNFATATEWTSGLLVYKGALYKHNDNYYVSKLTHTNGSWDNDQWVEVSINGYNPETLKIYAQSGGSTIELLPINNINIWEKEETYPVISDYNADLVKGNVLQYCFGRYENISNYTLYLEITDVNGNLANNFQPSGKIFTNIDITMR